MAGLGSVGVVGVKKKLSLFREIILVLNLTILNFSGLLIIYFFETQSNDVLMRVKLDPAARSQGMRV